MNNNILNMEELRKAAELAKEEIKTWPAWQLEAVELVSYYAASEQSSKFLYAKNKKI